MPHNFRLQKENGIFIKNFYGEEQNDTTLLDLIPILQEIASDPNNDVRKELKKMENEIFSKITTDMK
jgi:TFIIF-interacting CTD phosphatase-like protein